MKIQDIITVPGMYKSKQLKKGVGVNISTAGVASLIAYKSIDSIIPVETVLPVYKGLFEVEFEVCKNRQDLF